jgi:RNA polymerase sigma-70 factor (ECF subfamily)
MSKSEDLELVGRMLGGEEEAFEAFGQRYGTALYRFAASLLAGDRDLTRDLVQTTMTKALAKLDTYRGEASLLTWLCTCCRNEIRMHFRRLRAAPPELELEDEVAPVAGDPSRDPESLLLRREAARRVHMALDLLPGHYARALEWKYVEHLPVDEIAARLGVRPKAAESLLTRARQAFRGRYDDLREERTVFAVGLEEEETGR